MAWTQQSTKSTGDLVTAADWNAVVNNLKYLAAGSYVVQEPATGSDYSTTSTGFTNVDTNEWTVDITPVADATAVKITAQFTLVTNAVTAYFDITRDGTRLANTTNGMFYQYIAGTSEPEAIVITFIDDGITPGNTHTYKLQWKASSGTLTIRASSSDNPVLIAEEVH